MSANNILVLTLFNGVFIVISLFGPYISIGAYPMLVSCLVNFLWLIIARRVQTSSASPTNSSLKSFVKYFFLTIASSVIPLGLFLFWVAEGRLVIFAICAVLLGGFACGRIMGLLEKVSEP